MSPEIRVVVIPVLTLQVRTGGATCRVLLAAASMVRIEQRNGASWTPLGTVSHEELTARSGRPTAPPQRAWVRAAAAGSAITVAIVVVTR